MRLIVISNWLFGVACLAPETGESSAQDLAARYFFTQFWGEFTIEVLQDFSNDDKEHRRQQLKAIEEAEKEKKRLEEEDMAL